MQAIKLIMNRQTWCCGSTSHHTNHSRFLFCWVKARLLGPEHALPIRAHVRKVPHLLAKYALLINTQSSRLLASHVLYPWPDIHVSSARGNEAAIAYERVKGPTVTSRSRSSSDWRSWSLPVTGIGIRVGSLSST